MFTSAPILIIVKKIHQKGFKWFRERLFQEFRTPQTSLGKKILWCNKLIYSLMPSGKINKDKSNLYLFYDLDILPITFDISWILCLAEVCRQHLHLPSLKVIFVPGNFEGMRQENPEYDLIINSELRHWRKRNILISMLALLPSCKSFTYCANRKEAEIIRSKFAHYVCPFSYQTLFPTSIQANDLYNLSSPDVMALRATPASLTYIKKWLNSKTKDKKIITITLRQYDYMPKRNSNITAWENFTKKIDSSLYYIIIVPDTEASLQLPSPAFDALTYCIEACWNIELRMALYESSFLNLGINNGPFALCWLNKMCRYIMFKIHTEAVTQTNRETFEKLGLPFGSAPKFLTTFQKWVWKDDNEAVLLEEFNNMCNKIANTTI